MASGSVGGLVSGLDTATIVSQLMQVEAISQTRIKSQMATEQSGLKSLQDLNSKLAALATSAEKLAKASGWNPVTTTSSSDKVTVSGGPSATLGAVSFTVGRLAQAHSLAFADSAQLTATVTTGSTKVTLDPLDGTPPREIDTGDGTMAGLVRGINAAGTGLQASTVRLDDGSYRLRVTSSATGADSDFTLANLDGSALLGGAVVTSGQDAEITVGSDVLHSASNTFTGSVNGLDITLDAGVAAGTTVDVTVNRDTTSLTTSVKELVDAVNSAIADIDKLSAYNSATKKSAVLAGDTAVRGVRTALLESVYPADGTTMAGVGIQTDRYGKLVFDEAAFKAALAKDPSAVTAAFATTTTEGFATRVQSVAKAASDSVDGTVTTAINGRTAGIDRMQDSIDDWDLRLELRRDTLTRQFTALESALSRMNSQSSWLAGQLGALSGSSS
jgi:flagellar hook-associated protein 2